MDELDLLKKHWQQQDSGYKQYNANELYGLLHKKSNSIVKLLFYISVAELLFWIAVSFIPLFTSDNYRQHLNEVYTNDWLFNGLTVFSFAIITVFIFLLYKSYRKISVTDNVKQLMQSILHTRKIVKYYVVFNLSMLFLSFVILLTYVSFNNPEVHDKLAHYNNKELFGFLAGAILIVGITLLIFWLFYRLIYGILVRRLTKNYNELKKMNGN